jgi:hypothetical protein
VAGKTVEATLFCQNRVMPVIVEEYATLGGKTT